MLGRTAEDYDRAVRAVHAKAHGIFAGEPAVDSGPAKLAQGIFAHARAYLVYLRLSSNAGNILPDAEGTTRDFIMVNGTVFQTPKGGLCGAAQAAENESVMFA